MKHSDNKSSTQESISRKNSGYFREAKMNSEDGVGVESVTGSVAGTIVHSPKDKDTKNNAALPPIKVLKKFPLYSPRVEKRIDPAEMENFVSTALASKKDNRTNKLQSPQEKKTQQTESPNIDKTGMKTKFLNIGSATDNKKEKEKISDTPQVMLSCSPGKSAPLHQSPPTSDPKNANKLGASVASGQGTRPNQTPIPPGMYSLRQFQKGLARAIIACDILRFEHLLKMYKKCVEKNKIFNPNMKHSVTNRSSGQNENSAVVSIAYQTDDEEDKENEEDRSLMDRVVDYTTGYTMTHLAVASGVPELVEACVNFGSAVNTYDDFSGDTPLTLALNVLPEVVEMMMKKGHDVKASRVNMYGRSLLHSAVAIEPGTAPWNGRFAFIKFLVEECNLKASLKDPFGYTASALARDYKENFNNKKEYEEICNFLHNAELKENPQLEPYWNEEESDESEENKKKEQTKAKQTRPEHAAVVTKPKKGAPVKYLPRLSPRMQMWDRVRFIFSGPMSRLLCIMFLIFFHILEYIADVADRADDSAHIDAHSEFWFTVINNIGSAWSGSAFFMGMMHFGCCFGSAVIGAILFRYIVHHCIGALILRLPIFGVQSTKELSFLSSSFGAFYPIGYNGKARGSFFSFTVGAVLGVYSGAKLYNLALQKIWPGQLPWALILPTIPGLDPATALRNFLVATLILDWYVFVFVSDLMYQQGSLNVYLPNYRFAFFASSLNRILQWGKRGTQLRSKDIYYVRLWFYWAFLLIGWILIAVCFIIIDFRSAPARIFFASVLVHASWPGITILLASLCILMECVIICQEWTWPSFQEHPFLHFPGCTVVTHNAWFLVLIMLALCSLDIRMIDEHIILLQNQSDGMSTKDQTYVLLSLLPAFFGIALLLYMIVRSSLWWDEKDTGLYSAHVYSKPSLLPDDGAAQLEKQMRRVESVSLRRSMSINASIKNKKNNVRMHKALRKMEKDFSDSSTRRQKRLDPSPRDAPATKDKGDTVDTPVPQGLHRKGSIWSRIQVHLRVSKRNEESCSSTTSSLLSDLELILKDQKEEVVVVASGCETNEAVKKDDEKPDCKE